MLKSTLEIFKKSYLLFLFFVFLGCQTDNVATPSEATAEVDMPAMGFFLTSVGLGDGANLGGLAGADQHCKLLATAVGQGDKTWRAYLSTASEGGEVGINARDRIGPGPWINAKGVEVASSVANLHGEENNLTKETVLSEKGNQVNGRGDSPNKHDILSGSGLDGNLYVGEGDVTCGNWASNRDGSARVGHHDRNGGGENPTSWLSAHNTQGCSQENLQSTGGDGLFYCFVAD